ncbi:MAG: TnsA endonuclease N-terminal domain-containing protein [Bacillota bacterium]
MTEEKMKRWIKEGRGKGEGAEYKPWIEIYDCPSIGKVRRIKGWKTNRVHHFLSSLESNYFYMLEWSDNVVDIREQFPLDLEITMEIAAIQKIRYPLDPVSRYPNVQTTDFLITKEYEDSSKLLARTIKYEKDLDKRRVREKFRIEKLYWQERKIDWGVVTEKSFSLPLLNNIKYVHKYKTLDGYLDLTRDEINIIKLTLSKVIETNSKPLTYSTHLVDRLFNLQSGSCLTLAKYLIANKIWIVEMGVEIWKQPHFKINSEKNL